MKSEDWSGTRVAAVLARLRDAGFSEQKLARLADVSQPTINRWARAERRPGHDPIRRLALGVWRTFPAEARELVEAAGYIWAEPSENEAPPPFELRDGTRRAILDDLGGDSELATEVIAYIEHLASGRLAPARAAHPRVPGREDQRKQG
jgi:transcriptional regulator with XRE-family HTH domain